MADKPFINGRAANPIADDMIPMPTTPDHAVVFHQLDDLNALGDALASAARDGDAEHLASLRASLDRFAVGMGWRAEAIVPAVLAYVDQHRAFEEDLFGPAFSLRAVAPEHPETLALLARLPQSVRELLALRDGAGTG